MDSATVIRSDLKSQKQFGAGTINDPIWLNPILHTEENAPYIPIYKPHVR
jgi:hypothetical protein